MPPRPPVAALPRRPHLPSRTQSQLSGGEPAGPSHMIYGLEIDWGALAPSRRVAQVRTVRCSCMDESASVCGQPVDLSRSLCGVKAQCMRQCGQQNGIPPVLWWSDGWIGLTAAMGCYAQRAEQSTHGSTGVGGERVWTAAAVCRPADRGRPHAQPCHPPSQLPHHVRWR